MERTKRSLRSLPRVRDSWSYLYVEPCHSSNSDQGFTIRYHGKPTRAVVDFEGIALVRMAD